MHVVMDAYTYHYQAQGGVSRIYNEVLPRMCVLDGQLEITLLLSGSVRQDLPQHPRIHHRALFPVDDLMRPGRLWWQHRPTVRGVLHSTAYPHSYNQIWHPTYYSLPRRWDGPMIFTVYDLIHERFSDHYQRPAIRAIRSLKEACLERADAVISISQTTAEDLMRFYNVDPARIRVIHLAASAVFRRLDASQPRLSPPTSKPYLLYIGRRALYKNFDRLLQAYALWQYNSEIALVAIGPGWSRAEKSLIRNLGLEKKVLLVRRISDEELCQYYNGALALVYPSLYEGFGIPLVEAMACGCPIVASRIPSTEEIAGDYPIYFEPASTDSLRDALEQAALGAAQTQVGIERARLFNWNKTAQEILDVYRTMVPDMA